MNKKDLPHQDLQPDTTVKANLSVLPPHPEKVKVTENLLTAGKLTYYYDPIFCQLKEQQVRALIRLLL